MQEQRWYKDLKEKRVAYGVSQNNLATVAGITRVYLNNIENGKKVPSDKVKESLLENLEKFNPECPLEMLIDYVRMRFPTCDVKYIIQNILRLKAEYMLYQDFGYYSYDAHYRFGDIVVMVSPDIKKGVLLELKGKGCRQFESYLLAQHRTWYDFFEDVKNENCVSKRIDLAINDKAGILSIPDLIKKSEQEECISVFRSFKSYRSGELTRRDEKIEMGNTLYIGSFKSEVYFCIYEKDYEQYKKNNVPIEDAKVKNRFEIRLKNERAHHAMQDLLAYRDAEKTAFEIINRYMRFADKEEGKRRSEWKTNERWKWFIGDQRGALKLTTKPEPYSYEKTLNWLKRQVAPTLKIALTLDSIRDTDRVNEMVQSAKITEKHEKILEQQAMKIEDIIV